MNGVDSQAMRYSTLLAILKHRGVVSGGGALFVLIVLGWCGFRTGIADFYVLAMLAAGGVYFMLRAAIEVVDLVAETLMPR